MRADASITVQREEQEAEREPQKEVNILLSKFCSRLDTLASVNIINDPHEKRAVATVTQHNLKSAVTQKAVLDTVSDGDMLASHEVFSVKESDSNGSTELKREECKAKIQRNKIRGADQQKAQAAP